MNTSNADKPAAVLMTQHLVPGYDNNILFNDLNLSLHLGEVVCLMGPNGAGKSSLLRTIAGLQPALAGQIVFPGTEKSKVYENIAVVLADKIRVANMTAFQLITYGRYPYVDWNMRLQPRDLKIINDAIAQVNIASLADKKLETLSDGQLQLVLIARALAQDTPILLLDEPTAHLDLNNRLEIMNLLQHLSSSTGKAILVATHELDLAVQTADRIWLATRDKTIVTGLPEDLILKGVFDEVFQLKGYNLLTGKIDRHPHRKTKIKISGESPQVLWTKNALERSGFEISDVGATEVSVLKEGGLSWWHSGNKFVLLEDLLEDLKRIEQ